MSLPNIQDWVEVSREEPTASFGLIKKLGEWIETQGPSAEPRQSPPPAEREFQDESIEELVQAIEKRFRPKYKPAMSVAIGEPDFLPFANLSLGQKLGSAVCRITKTFDEASATDFHGKLVKFENDVKTKEKGKGKGNTEEIIEITARDIVSLFPLKPDNGLLRFFIEEDKKLAEIESDEIIQHFYEVCATGFLVSRNYLLTNYHVFSNDTQIEVDTQIESPEEKSIKSLKEKGIEAISLVDKRYVAEFGYEMDSLSRQTQSIRYRMTEIVLYDKALDYALVRLDPVSLQEDDSRKENLKNNSLRDNSLGKMPGDLFNWVKLLDDTAIIAPAIGDDFEDKVRDEIAEQFKAFSENRLLMVKDYELKTGRFDDNDKLPIKRKKSIYLGKVEGSYHVRIFDEDKNVIADKGGNSFVPNSALMDFIQKREADKTSTIAQEITDKERQETIPHIVASLYSVDEGLKKRGRQGDLVNIIQHPRGRRKEVVLSNNRLKRLSPDYLDYTADIDFSSSGSPVFNQQWQLVGLHRSAKKKYKRDVSSGKESLIEIQKGVRTCRIVESIRGKIIFLIESIEHLSDAVVVVEEEKKRLISLWSFFNFFVDGKVISLDELLIGSGREEGSEKSLSPNMILNYIIEDPRLQANSINEENDTNPLHFLLKFTDASLGFDMGSGELLNFAAGNTVVLDKEGSKASWQGKVLEKDKLYAFRHNTWKNFYWKVNWDVDKEKGVMSRIESHDLGGEGPEEYLRVEEIYETDQGDNIVVKFREAYLESYKSGALRITAENMAVSYGDGWIVKELKPHIFHMRLQVPNPTSEGFFYWQVNTLNKIISKVTEQKRNDTFGKVVSRKTTPIEYVEVVY